MGKDLLLAAGLVAAVHFAPGATPGPPLGPSSVVTIVGVSQLDGDVRDAAMTTTRVL